MRSPKGHICLNDENSLSFAYVLFSLLSALALLAAFQLSKGELISRWFFADVRDTGMDFFHSIEYVRGRDPYTIFGVIYPPLANAFFLFLFNLIPRSISGLWTYDFGESIGFRGTGIDLRTYQATMILFILFVVVSAFLILEVSRYILREKKPIVRSLVAFCVLISYGMLFAFERGNVLLLSWIFAAFFLSAYDNESKIIRELALLSLAASAGLKLYPALFGLILLDKKQFKAAIRAIIYGILSVLLPTVVFHGGVRTLPLWVSQVIRFGAENQKPNTLLLYNGSSLQIVLTNLRTLLHVSVSDRIITIVSLSMLALLLLSVFYRKKYWQKVLTLTLAVVMISSQGDYVFCYFAIPMLFLLAEEERFSAANLLGFVTLTLLTADLPIFYKYQISYPRSYLSQFLMLLLLLESIAAVFASFAHKEK